jgi:hypothetical protein
MPTEQVLVVQREYAVEGGKEAGDACEGFCHPCTVIPARLVAVERTEVVIVGVAVDVAVSLEVADALAQVLRAKIS